MARRFYRIVKTDPPAEIDFTSNEALGIVPYRRDPETLRLWDGISMYDSEGRARRKARDFPWLGSYIAAVDVPETGELRYERTTSSRGHYTLWGDPSTLRAMIAAVVPV